MKSYTVTLATYAVITGSMTVVADNYEDAIAEAVSRCDEADWPISEHGTSLHPSPGRAFVIQAETEDGALPRDFRDGTGLAPATAAKLGVGLLKSARDMFKHAGARQTLDRVRKAITSAGGAVRNAEGRQYR